jgi:hypothetical protein
MREIDLDTLVMIGATWFHGLAIGWVLWRRPHLKYRNKDEE